MIACAKQGTNHQRPWIDFRPSEAERTSKKLRLFMDVAKRIEAEGETQALMAELDKVRTRNCIGCRTIQRAGEQNEDTLKGKTFQFWHRVSLGTCQFCTRANVPLEWRHTHGEKTHNVSDYAFWAVNGGVEAMQKEMKKCTPVCRNCAYIHFTQEQNETDYVDVDAMPCSTPGEKSARWRRTQKNIKYAHVAELKRSIGGCADCGMQVEEGMMRVFVFAHEDAARRGEHVCDLCRLNKSASVAIPLIDAEVKKCRLLCQTCHQMETRSRNSAKTTEEVYPAVATA